MTGKQSAVMWAGLLLVTLRMFTTGQWDALWSTTTGSAPAGTGGITNPNMLKPTAPNSSAETGATGSVAV